MIRRVCIIQTDVEFKKEQRVLGTKEKNNYLATANLRSTEYMAKRARVHQEPSELRYEMHLRDIHTPEKFATPSVPSAPSTGKCESEVNSMQPPPDEPGKQEADTDDAVLEESPAPAESSKRKRGLLGRFF